jgi:hypothetical protein
MRSLSISLLLFSLAVAFATQAIAQSDATRRPHQPSGVVFVFIGAIARGASP